MATTNEMDLCLKEIERQKEWLNNGAMSWPTEALNEIAANVGEAFSFVMRAFREHEKRIARLENHRHDITRNLSGKPEL